MRKKAKKAQLQGNVLLYLLGAIIIALVLVAGFKAISNFRKQGETAKFEQFETNLNQDVKELQGDFGSEKTKTFVLPTGYDEICFVDLARVDESVSLIVGYPMIKDSVQKGIKKNVFFLGTDKTESIYVQDLSLSTSTYFWCNKPEKTNQVEIKLEGKANSTAVRTPPLKDYCDNAQKESLCDTWESLEPGVKEDCCKNYGLCCPT